MVTFQDNPALTCKKCGAKELRRLHRHGFIERVLYSFFGYFPWECPVCRERVFVKSRGRKKRRRTES